MKTNKKTKIIISVLAVIIAVLNCVAIILLCVNQNECNDLTSGSPKKSHSASDKLPDESPSELPGNSDDEKDDTDNPFGNGEYTVIELQKFVKLDIAKPRYNGYGAAKLSFDESYLNKIKTDKYFQYLAKQSEDVQWWLEDIESCEDLFKISLNYKDGSESYNNLSNGDKVYFEISLHDALTDEGLTLKGFCDGIGIKFDKTSGYLVVEGLTDPGEDFAVLDVLGHIKDYLLFEGVDGDGEVSFDESKLSTEDILIFEHKDYWIRFQSMANYADSKAYFYAVYDNKTAFDFTVSITSEREKLSAGMTVSLKLEITQDYGVTDAWILTATEYNLIIKQSDLGTYLTEEELKFSETIEKVKSYLKSQKTLGFNGEYIVSFDSMYLATIKPGVKNEYEKKYALVVVTYEEPFLEGYCCHILYDIYCIGDSIFANWDCHPASYEETVSKVLARLDDDYTYKLVIKFE